MPEPIYRRIADDLRLRIESGELAPGSKLPTELALRDTYRVSRNTIRDALRWLLNRGLVDTRHGQGTFVASRFKPFITTLSPDWQADSGPGGGEGQAGRVEVEARSGVPDASPPAVGIKLATGNVAARLRLAEGTNVVSRHQELYIDGCPWSLQTSYYPMRLVDMGARRLLDAFGSEFLRVELQRPYARHDRARNRALAALARRLGVACVATGDVHAHTRSSAELQDSFVEMLNHVTIDDYEPLSELDTTYGFDRTEDARGDHDGDRTG